MTTEQQATGDCELDSDLQDKRDASTPAAVGFDAEVVDTLAGNHTG